MYWTNRCLGTGNGVDYGLDTGMGADASTPARTANTATPAARRIIASAGATVTGLSNTIPRFLHRPLLPFGERPYGPRPVRRQGPDTAPAPPPDASRHLGVGPRHFNEASLRLQLLRLESGVFGTEAEPP